MAKVEANTPMAPISTSASTYYSFVDRHIHRTFKHLLKKSFSSAIIIIYCAEHSCLLGHLNGLVCLFTIGYSVHSFASAVRSDDAVASDSPTLNATETT